jgi:cardiolipin synthase
MNTPWLQILKELLLPNWQGGLGIAFAMIVGLSMLRQRRKRGNIVAWTFFILVFPILGSLLYLTFGGRKIQKTAATKRAINKIAGVLTYSPDNSQNSPPSTPYTTGNAITLLDDEDGISTWNALCSEIAAAKTSIHIATYILGCDTVGRELIARLATRAREGVQVRLLVDALGSLGSKWSLCAPLEKAGGRMRRFMPILPFRLRGSANLRNHRKIAIFDGQRAITGGQNLALEYIGPTPHRGRYRDFSARVEGPAVAALTRIFLSDWCFASGESPGTYREQLRFRPAPAGAVRIETVSGGPDQPDDPLWERIITLIQESRKELTLVTPYLVPDEVLFRVLLLKVRAGLRTRLILPKKSDHPLLDFARRPCLRALHQAGAEILFYGKQMLHGKLFIIDRSIGVIGSANLDIRSLLVNFEVATIIHSPNTMRRFRLLADSLAADSSPYSATKYGSESLRNQFMESLAHMVSPLL